MLTRGQNPSPNWGRKVVSIPPSAAQCFASWRQLNQNFAMIIVGMRAPNRAAFDQPVYKFYRTVVTQAKPFSKSRDRGASCPRQTLDGEKKLMLLRFDPFSPRCFFSVVQEFPDMMMELGKATKAKLRNGRSRRIRKMVIFVLTHGK